MLIWCCIIVISGETTCRSRKYQQHNWHSNGRQLQAGEHLESSKNCNSEHSTTWCKQANNETSGERSGRSHWDGNKSRNLMMAPLPACRQIQALHQQLLDPPWQQQWQGTTTTTIFQVPAPMSGTCPAAVEQTICKQISPAQAAKISWACHMQRRQKKGKKERKTFTRRSQRRRKRKTRRTR